jgi:hypothetical protein
MLVLAVQSEHGPIERLEAKATTREAGAEANRFLDIVGASGNFQR